MKTKLLLAAVALAAIPATATAQRAPAATIVVVDTNRVARECTACVSARAALQAQEQALQQRAVTLGAVSNVQGQPAALDREGQELQNAVNALPAGRQPDAALQARINAFTQRRQAAANELQTLQQNLQSTQVNISQQLSRALQPIFNQVMTARGANLVISTDARLTSAPALDVTNDVLAALNRSTPALTIAPLPAQQGQQQPQPQQPRPTGR